MSSSIFESDVTSEVSWSLVGRIPGDPDPKRIPIPVTGAVVGRSASGIDIVLPSGFVSNRHAQLQPRGERLEVRDLKSCNGTYLRRERVNGSGFVNDGDTLAFADVEFQVEADAKDGDTNDALCQATAVGMESFDGHWTLSNFARLIQERLVKPVVQPIVEIGSHRVIGQESLARSSVPGLETPAKMFEAAELLNKAAVLSEICRINAIEAARDLPPGQRLFLNTHPAERLREDVLHSVHAIRRRLPSLLLVIEVHEDLIGELAETRTFSRELAAMGAELALDDFGAGRSRINEVLRLRPAFVKFDRSMICNIDRAPAAELRAMKSLVDLLDSLSIRCIAEGIERRAEAVTCQRLGFELAQGFYYAHPSPFPGFRRSDETQVVKPTKAPRRNSETKEYDVLVDL